MRLLTLCVVLLTIALPATASAEKITLGSDLSAPATITQANGADTAFWAQTVGGNALDIPVDGQIVAIRVKGSALKEQGAADPATLVHFQSLDPAGPNGARVVYKTSQSFNMPFDNPAAITEFVPENLCVRRGGAVAFNTIGGFKWGGSLDAPLDDNSYLNGTPWQIFASARQSTTNWYSKDNGTKNGMTLTPAGGADAREGYGAAMAGTELLMQVVLATGDDVSFECGGPRRDGNGNVMEEMSVNAGQQPYVSADGSFRIVGYCGSRIGDCAGATMTVTVNGRTVASGTFSAKEATSFTVPLKLAQADYVALTQAAGSQQEAIVTMASALGTYTGKVTLRTKVSSALSVVKNQKTYVLNNRSLRPAAYCGLPAGCSGTATLTAKGKTLARATFKTTKAGAVFIKMKLTKPAFRKLKKAKVMLAKLTATGSFGTSSESLLLRK